MNIRKVDGNKVIWLNISEKYGNKFGGNKFRILWILYNAKREMNILDISKKLGIKYKSTYQHIIKLEQEGFIHITQEINHKGKNNFIHLKI
jgi:DNA-binding MarR family transcriptional regulator|tara:strand:+ start:1134 stop:1406 length:273 start_codon:yes stop_codon:yes gene_type:complete